MKKRTKYSAIKLVNVSERYGEREALIDIHLNIYEGELMTVVGVSGCGKSTLSRSIAGLEEIDGGDICIGGRRVNTLPPHQRNVAMVLQKLCPLS